MKLYRPRKWGRANYALKATHRRTWRPQSSRRNLPWRWRRLPSVLTWGVLVALAVWHYVLPDLPGLPAATTETPSSGAVTSRAVVGRASVIDGDTLEIHGTRVRLVGIDAPESSQSCQDASGRPWRCGQVAATALADKIGASLVTCEGGELDAYGRLLAVCQVGNEDLGGWLVREGLALAYRRYSSAYIAQENSARAAHKGVWVGTFVRPWDWRAQGNADQQAQTQPQTLVPGPADAQNPGSCLIKGNINSKGERIYHVPGGRWYDETKISESKGERWFCSESEAIAAGWRKSKK